MVTPVVALLLTAQSYASGSQRSLEWLSNQVDVEKVQYGQRQAEARFAEFQERQFIESYNELVRALTAFSKKYQTQHVIDVKSVDSIKKAYQRLERADAWFRRNGPK